MFITDVDTALEKFFRARIPLPEHIADIAFDQPTENWSAGLSRLTINLFLYNIQKSTQPSRTQQEVRDGEGKVLQQRKPIPMIDLTYLVSPWAGSPRDEHQLLGDALSAIAAVNIIPAEFCPETLNSSVLVILGDDAKPREFWQAIGNKLKPSFTMRCTVAANTWDWEESAPPVEGIKAMADRVPDNTSAREAREAVSGENRKKR